MAGARQETRAESATADREIVISRIIDARLVRCERHGGCCARAVFDATSRFHNPAHAAKWSSPGTDTAYDGVRVLVLRGLERRHSRTET
jgi:Tetracyclin repressor-like, C-terminal domain